MRKKPLEGSGMARDGTEGIVRFKVHQQALKQMFIAMLFILAPAESNPNAYQSYNGYLEVLPYGNEK